MDTAGLRPAVVVVGNEKGGSGKSTTAIHVAVALLHRGLSVGALDLDSRQATMTRYMENRRRYGEDSRPVPMPRFARLDEPDGAAGDAARAVAEEAVDAALESMADCDVVVADTPGSLTMLSRVGHERADTLVTPVNDSLLDIDVLAEIDPARRTIVAPSFYCRMAWEYSNRRVIEGLAPVDWLVVRNRLAHVHSHNRRDVERILERLAQRVGFRLAPGLSERVVFRELFASGLTVLDLPVTEEHAATASRRAALVELEALVDALGVVPTADRTARVTGALSAE